MRSASTPPHVHEPDNNTTDMATTIAMRNDTVMDTRTPSPVGRPSSPDAAGESDKYKPDLSAEVAMLSTKLVNAINYQTNLDDSLQHARHELGQARKELARVRAEKKELDDQVASGFFVRKSVTDRTIAQLRADVIMERTAREASDKAKKETDGELENLTTALFEEANTMVAAARKDTEAVERRNSQLRGQLNDTELLLASQQEQLRDLKDTMERMERTSEYESTGHRGDTSMPSTPITANFDALNLSPSAESATDIPPEHPLHFSQLLAPILRLDVAAYNEFQELVLVGGRVTPVPHSRNTSSGNSNTIASSSQPNLHAGSAISSPNIPGAFSFSANSSPQSTTFSQAGPPLKESKFYKRIVIEDLEPTLRLDLAPGLNLFSRRTVLSSLLQGSLVVEPFLPSAKFYGPVFACALCGESRKNEPYVRKHRFRTSEEESAQRYPLCDYCLNRVRASGDFVGFLRMLRDGHWKAESNEEQKSAWEESVRLRERMFWARLGGGVVPVQQTTRRELTETPSTTAAMKSGRPSLDSIQELRSPPETRRNTLAAKTPPPPPESDGTGSEKDEVSQDSSASEDERPVSVLFGGKVNRASLSGAQTAEVSAHDAVNVRPMSLLQKRQSDASNQLSLELERDSEGTPHDATTDVETRESVHAAEEQESETEANASETPTPFEDARSDVHQLALSSPEPEPSPKIELPERTKETSPPAITTTDTATATAATPAITTNSSVPLAVDSSSAPSKRTPSPAKTLTPSPNSLAPAPAPKAERRPSGVLARVRAMEAQAQTKGAAAGQGKRAPGSFD